MRQGGVRRNGRKELITLLHRSMEWLQMNAGRFRAEGGACDGIASRLKQGGCTEEARTLELRETLGSYKRERILEKEELGLMVRA